MPHQHAPAEHCAHMEGLLNQLATGELKGFKAWLTAFHVARCTKCSNFVDRLKRTITALNHAKQAPSDEVMDRLKQKLAASDSQA